MPTFGLTFREFQPDGVPRRTAQTRLLETDFDEVPTRSREALLGRFMYWYGQADLSGAQTARLGGAARGLWRGLASDQIRVCLPSSIHRNVFRDQRGQG